jgi:hypothetical protein
MGISVSLGLMFLSNSTISAQPLKTSERTIDPPPRFTDLVSVKNPAKKVHALLIMDTNAEDIKASIEVDQRNLEWMLTEAFKGDETLLSLTILSGDNANPDKIREYFKNLPRWLTGESLLVYYSGHGYLDPKQGHFLQITKGYLNRYELRGMMGDKQPQLAVLITDCCNNVPDALKIGMLQLAIKRQPERAVNAERVRHLLMEQGGFVDINGAQPGTTAYCNDTHGGYLTHEFVNACCTFGDTVTLPKMQFRFSKFDDASTFESVKPLKGSESVRLDSDKDGVIRWNEFFDNLVKRKTAALSNYERVPDFLWLHWMPRGEQKPFRPEDGYIWVPADPAKGIDGHWERKRIDIDEEGKLREGFRKIIAK